MIKFQEWQFDRQLDRRKSEMKVPRYYGMRAGIRNAMFGDNTFKGMFKKNKEKFDLIKSEILSNILSGKEE